MTVGSAGLVADPTFRFESPLTTARRMAEQEIYGKASHSELAWLHEHVPLWLRALVRIRHEVESHIAKDRIDLAPLKPPAGKNADQKYLDAKAEFDKRTQRRLHFMQIVERRTEEVKAMLGPLDKLMLGDIIEAFLDIEVLIQNEEHFDAASKASFWADMLAGNSPLKRPKIF